MLKEIITSGALVVGLINEYKKYEKKQGINKSKEPDEETIMLLQKGVSIEHIPFAKELRKKSDDMIRRFLNDWDSSLEWRYDLLLEEAKRRGLY